MPSRVPRTLKAPKYVREHRNHTEVEPGQGVKPEQVGGFPQNSYCSHWIGDSNRSSHSLKISSGEQIDHTCSDRRFSEARTGTGDEGQQRKNPHV